MNVSSMQRSSTKNYLNLIESSEEFDSRERMLHALDYVILVSALAGIVINIAGFIIIYRKQKEMARNRSSPSMFHDLLKMLMFYDAFVVICCLLQYSLPNIWYDYNTNVRLPIIPVFHPFMHIAVMSSVYCTILMSFERYIRICYFCQLRTTKLLTEDNFKFYKVFLIIFPTLFYLPKFFEVYFSPGTVESETLACKKYLGMGDKLQRNPQYLDKLLRGERAKLAVMNIIHSCIELNRNTTTNDGELGIQNLTLTQTIANPSIQPTSLRLNQYYYGIYYVFLNTMFASLLPLGLLLFLNVKTAQELFKMGKNEVLQAVNIGQGVMMMNENQQENEFPSRCSSLTPNSANCQQHPSCKDAFKKTVETDGLVKQEEANGKLCGAVSEGEEDIILHHPPKEDITEASTECRSDEENNMDADKKRSLFQRGTGMLSFDIPDHAPPLRDAFKKFSGTFTEKNRSFRASLRKASIFRRQNRSTSLHSMSSGINKTKERKLACISLYIVWLFIFCHVWKLIPTGYEVMMSEDKSGWEMHVWPFWLEVIEKVSHTLITMNSSLNFLIYIVV